MSYFLGAGGGGGEALVMWSYVEKIVTAINFINYLH